MKAFVSLIEAPVAAALLCLLPVCAAGAASAQPGQGQAPHGQANQGQANQGQANQGQANQVGELHSILHIRPDQEAAFRSYQASGTPTPEQLTQLRANMDRAVALRTPERLDLVEKSMVVQESIARRRVDAMRRFYAQLSPDQQRTFDQITRPRPSQGAPR